MVPILCYSVFQDQTTMSLCFITHKVFNFYLCPVQDQVMMHQHILFSQSLPVPSVIVLKEDDVEVIQINLPSSKAITVFSLLQQEAYKHRSVLQLFYPTSSLLMELHQSACRSQDKLEKDEIVLTLKVLFSSSSPSSFYFMSKHCVSKLLMLSLLALILLPTAAKQEVGQVILHKSILIGGKHCVQTDMFYIFISISWLLYLYLNLMAPLLLPYILCITFGQLETTIHAQYSLLLGSLQ